MQVPRSSQSRIPISTRRMSATSDSGKSTQSALANSALGRTELKPPTRILAPTSKHNKMPRGPPQQTRSNTSQKLPRRSDFSATTQRPATCPRLNAYISAPMPKKSPPGVGSVAADQIRKIYHRSTRTFGDGGMRTRSQQAFVTQSIC